MAIAILLLIVGLIVDILIIRMQRKEAEMPFLSEWKFDENVTAADEARAVELLTRYGKEDILSLPTTFILPESVREVVERYSTLEFDDYTMAYTRKDLLKGEETQECWKGFYCIGGDGGEISFYVRKSTDDEKVYAFDMEWSSRPEPYASNIRRYIVMRHNDWLGARGNEEKRLAKSRSVWFYVLSCAMASLGGIVILCVDAFPLYFSLTFLCETMADLEQTRNVRAAVLGFSTFTVFSIIALMALRSIVRSCVRVLRGYFMSGSGVCKEEIK